MKKKKQKRTEFKNYQEAIAFFEENHNEKKAEFDKIVINSPKLKYHGLDSAAMKEVKKHYSLLEGPLDYSFELTSLILDSNIAKINDHQELINYMLDFVYQVDNWAHVDAIFTFKKVKKLKHEEFFPQIKHTRDSDLEFVARFYYVAFIMYKARVELYDEFLAGIKDSEKYYVRMAIAWVISEMFPQDNDKILKYLYDAPLSKKTKMKTIQKIKESRRTTEAQRERLEFLKVRIKIN